MDGRSLGSVDAADLGLFIQAFRAAHNGQAWNSAADLNGDTFLNRADAVLMVEGLMANNSLFTIGPAGETASNAAGTATLVFPAGAVSGPTAVSIGAAGSLPADARYVAGTAFTFGPSGVKAANWVD